MGGNMVKGMFSFLLRPPITGCADDSASVSAGINGVAKGLDECTTTLAVNAEVSANILGSAGFDASIQECTDGVIPG